MAARQPETSAVQAPTKVGAAAVSAAAAASAAHLSSLPLWMVIAIALAGAFAAWAAIPSSPAKRTEMMSDKIKGWFRYSLTILWARIVALAGLLLAAAQSALADPTVGGAVQQLLQPQYIPYYVIAIGLITDSRAGARRRSSACSARS
jgi:hypothetical protein